MQTCGRCCGEGYETYDEDGRTVRDACYHCGTTGEIDDDLAWHDRLYNVASVIAYQREIEYRAAVNDDPDGDGYDLHAYENMMQPWDYFRTQVWGREPEILDRLHALPINEQKLLVAWNEYEVCTPTGKAYK